MQVMEIQQEMKMLHDMQMNGTLGNPLKMIFPCDKVEVIMKSNKDFLIAHSNLKNEKGNAYLRLLYVVEGKRNKGFGKFLINKLKKACVHNGIKGIETESENVSIGFFKKMGFSMMENETNNRMICRL